MTIIIFIIVLALLIFVHELGHFLAARACGIRVDAFALGFGPKIFSKKVGETTYSLNIVPFGGYVKIFGENPDEESVAGEDKERSFIHKNRLQQVIVLFAGIFFNFIFAWILFSLSFSIGVPASISSYPQYADQMEGQRIAITFVTPDSPAAKAGLKAGDTLIGESVEKLQQQIASSTNMGIDISYIRGGVEGKTRVVGEEGIIPGKYAIGIGMDKVGILELPIFTSIVEGFRFTLHVISQTVSGIYTLVAGIFHGTSNLSSVTGPIGIAGLVGDAAKLGFTYLLMFTALISINLGVLNLIPFPALDGGRILFVLIEAVIRRPMNPAVVNIVNTIGFGLLILLMIVVTYRDIVRLF